MRKTLTVPQKAVPILLDCDILVAGRGAGVAAAVAARHGVPVNEVDVGQMQDALRRQNTLLHVSF